MMGRVAATHQGGDAAEELAGGTKTVHRVGDRVVRPAGPHTPSVQRALRHARRRGFTACPRVIDLDPVAGTETLSFLPGAVSNYPLTDAFRSDRALVSAARLLRRWHDATADFQVTAGDRWFVPPRAPAEVVCHGDAAPYNCVVTGGEVTAMFDFDTAHPGPRLWDVGYGAYRWVPLSGLDHMGAGGGLDEQRRRLRLFCDAYGPAAADVAAVLQFARRSLAALVDTMHARAAGGDAAFAGHIADGHDRLYRDDDAWLAAHAGRLLSA